MMRIWPRKAAPQVRQDFTELVLNSDYGQVTGDDSRLDANAVGMVAFGVAMYCGAFAVAEITPAMPALDPDHMASIARRLITNGNAVDAITVGGDGLALLPASTWDIYGPPDPARWRYIVDVPGPSRDQTIRTSRDGVVHCRIGQGKYPWIGRSPLLNAGLTARMLARLELRLGDESRARPGYILEYDPGVSKATIDDVAANVKTANGGNDAGRERRRRRSATWQRAGLGQGSGWS